VEVSGRSERAVKEYKVCVPASLSNAEYVPPSPTASTCLGVAVTHTVTSQQGKNIQDMRLVWMMAPGVGAIKKPGSRRSKTDSG